MKTMSYLVVIACIFSSSICIVKKLKTKKGKKTNNNNNLTGIINKQRIEKLYNSWACCFMI